MSGHVGFWRDPEPGKRKPTWHVDLRLLFGILDKTKDGCKLKSTFAIVAAFWLLVAIRDVKLAYAGW